MPAVVQHLAGLVDGLDVASTLARVVGNRRRLPVYAAGSAGRRRPAPGRPNRRFHRAVQAGAYGLTASPTGFLGHPQPTELLV
jgi:hypothetical protein